MRLSQRHYGFVLPLSQTSSSTTSVDQFDNPAEAPTQTAKYNERPSEACADQDDPNVPDRKSPEIRSGIPGQTSHSEPQSVPKIRDDVVDIGLHGVSAVAGPSEGMASNEARLNDALSPVTESGNDPYREPRAIPQHRPPMFVYPYSGDKIPSVFQQRFREVVNIFMYNTKSNSKLRDSAPFIDYTLRMCGQSPEDSHPSILVFCRPSDLQPLKDLLSNERLRFQYCRKRPHVGGSWKGWSTSRRAAAPDDDVPLFDLFFWHGQQPRELS